MDPKFRDILTVVLPNGKYRFTVTPQGLSPSGDLFNILTDLEVDRDPALYSSVFKNVDDILIAADSIEDLRAKACWFFDICRKRNMKLAPRKIQLSDQVIFGGTVITSVPVNGKHCTMLDPTVESIDTILNLPTPKS